MLELLSFLKRTYTCAKLLMPHCILGRLCKQLYDALLDKGKHMALSKSVEWMRTKPGEIVHLLCQLATEEFQHVLPPHHFCAPNAAYSLDFYQGPSPTTFIQQCLSPTRVTVDLQLPVELRPRNTLPGNNHNPNTTPSSPYAPTRHLTNGPPGNTPRGTRPGQGRPPPAGQPHTNPRLHQTFKTFWQGVPPAQQNEGISRWLRQAQSSTSQALTILNLTGNDCGLFHIKGICSTPACPRRHTPREVTAEAAQTVVNLLREGQPQSA